MSDTLPPLTAEEFVTAWQKAKDCDELIEELDYEMDRRTAQNYAASLRRAGVPLKQFPKGGGKRDGRTPHYISKIDRLAELAISLRPKGASAGDRD